MRNELTSSMAGSNLGQSGDGSNVVISIEEYNRLMGKTAPVTQTFHRDDVSSVSKPTIIRTESYGGALKSSYPVHGAVMHGGGGTFATAGAIGAVRIVGPGATRQFPSTCVGTTSGSALFTTPGTYSWVAPPGVSKVSIVAVGAGGKSNSNYSGLRSGSGGGLGYKNNYSVTPGNSYTIVVGATGVTAGDSYFCSTSVVKGGGGAYSSSSPTAGGTHTGDGGGNGGYAGNGYSGGGAGGYSGNGGNGTTCGTGGSGSGGGGGGGGGTVYSGTCCQYGGAGGGVGLFGQGCNGAGGTSTSTLARGGFGGSGGSNGSNSNPSTPPSGGAYGGGGGSQANNTASNCGSGGAVRIIWPGSTRSFPSTCAGNP